MKIYPVTENTFSKAVQLLKKYNLPTEDINKDTLLFIMQEDEEVIGTVGLHIFNQDALLRSLCVIEEKRNCGAAIQMVEFIEALALTKGIRKLYLLTNTASSFFGKRQYTEVERSMVSDEIKGTAEFSRLCPATALVMVKQLA